MNYPSNLHLESFFPDNWKKYIDLCLLNTVSQKLRQKSESSSIYPYNPNDIFKVFSLCDLENIKIVILGQDPYYSNKDQANGIAFSVNNSIKAPPSLRNILKESKSQDSNLEKWVKQGVFLLNATLTVEEGKPNSHEKIWREFVTDVIRIINKHCNKIIFVAWGKFALKRYENVDKSKHIIIETSHPSPLSCYKTDKPFIGSNIFNNINEILVSENKNPIDW